MVKHAQFRAAETGGVHDAGVDQFVQDDEVVLAKQGADGAEGRGVASGETERGFGAFESRPAFRPIPDAGASEPQMSRDAPAPAP